MQRYLLSSESTHNGIIYIILAFFLGCIGIHNFYVGYWKRGLSQLALFAALWATLEIFFVNRSANGCLLGGNRLVIWILRATSALVLAWAALSSDMSITALDLQSLAEI